MRVTSNDRKQIEKAKSQAMINFVLGPVRNRTQEQAYVHRTMTQVFKRLNKSES